MRRIRWNGARCVAGVAQDVVRGVGRRLEPGGEHDVRLRNGESKLIGRGHDRRFDDGRVLDEHALEFERADLVVGCLEHVVGAADVGQVPVGIPRRDVAGVEVAALRGLGVALGVADVPGHQVGGLLREVDADLAFVGLHPGDGVDEHDRAAGQGATHGAVPDDAAG